MDQVLILIEYGVVAVHGVIVMDVRDPCRDQVRLSLTSFHHFLRCDSLSIR